MQGTSWGDKSNAQGEILSDFLQQEELIAPNDGESTFTCTNGKCNRLGFMQRQSTQAFLRPRNRPIAPNKGAELNV